MFLEIEPSLHYSYVLIFFNNIMSKEARYVYLNSIKGTKIAPLYFKGIPFGYISAYEFG